MFEFLWPSDPVVESSSEEDEEEENEVKPQLLPLTLNPKP